jgi:hypothetical protein
LLIVLALVAVGGMTAAPQQKSGGQATLARLWKRR